jgi:hypothetical protein
MKLSFQFKNKIFLPTPAKQMVGKCDGISMTKEHLKDFADQGKVPNRVSNTTSRFYAPIRQLVD